jgi:hypothetical protein
MKLGEYEEKFHSRADECIVFYVICYRIRPMYVLKHHVENTKVR